MKQDNVIHNWSVETEQELTQMFKIPDKGIKAGTKTIAYVQKI